MATSKIRSSKQINIDANLDLNSKKIINLADATSDYDAVNKRQLDSATSGMAQGLKLPVPDLAALKAVVVTAADDKYMIHVESLGLFRFDWQSTATNNNVSVVAPTSGTGRWLRFSDPMNDHNQLTGLQGGTTSERHHLTAAQHTSATRHANGSQNGLLSNIDWTTFNQKQDDLGISAIIIRETPTGVKNGSNTVFGLQGPVLAGTEHVYLNGLLQESGSGNDYTISSTTITMAEAPLSTDKILVSYFRS